MPCTVETSEYLYNVFIRDLPFAMLSCGSCCITTERCRLASPFKRPERIHQKKGMKKMWSSEKSKTFLLPAMTTASKGNTHNYWMHLCMMILAILVNLVILVSGESGNSDELSELSTTTEISFASSLSILFFTWVAPKVPFWPFFGPRGVKCRSQNANLAATQKPQMKMGPTQLDYWRDMLDGKRGPRVPVGGPMLAQQANVLEPKRKNMKSRFCLQRDLRYLR